MTHEVTHRRLNTVTADLPPHRDVVIERARIRDSDWGFFLDLLLGRKDANDSINESRIVCGGLSAAAHELGVSRVATFKTPRRPGMKAGFIPKGLISASEASLLEQRLNQALPTTAKFNKIILPHKK